MELGDTIADAFLNSSRKTLRFIPPSTQKDEIIIKPTPAMVEQGSRRWQSTAVGYFLGRQPYFPQLEAFARANWKGLQQVSATIQNLGIYGGSHRGGALALPGQPWCCNRGNKKCHCAGKSIYKSRFGFAFGTYQWNIGRGWVECCR
ncbi:UNVERIFIED_CONTAM: hypothetical protein Sradi_7101900 [Sesamum radiatum]|uniref:Uncharacterized protein n=1 Tax=Sesamum radiatum TaxID=300843 RepID=A0AAW2J1W7_SESRA